MRRTAVFVTVAFLCGIVISCYQLDIRIAAIFAVMMAIYSLCLRKYNVSTILIAFIIVIAGYMRMQPAIIKRADISHKYDDAVYNTELLVKDFPKDGAFSVRFTQGKDKLDVWLKVKKCPKLAPGDIIKAKITLSSPLYMHSRFDYTSYLSGKNIFLTASAEKVVLTKKKCSGIYGAACAVRCFIADASQRFFIEDVHGIFNAMLIGDRRYVSDRLDNALRTAGLSHIAVVSGMHLSVLISVLMLFIYNIFGKGRKGSCVSIIAAVFLTLVTGAGASIIRACIMCVIYQIADIFYRERDGLSALSTSVLIMTMFNPFIIINIGFIFSVLSVLGILLFSDRIYKALNFCPSFAATAMSVSISAQLMVLPVSIYSFGNIAIYSLLANVFVSVFGTLLLCFGFVFILFSCVPFISAGLAIICNMLALSIIGITEVIASLPGASLDIGKISILIPLLFYSFLLLVYFFPHKWRITVTTTALLIIMLVVVSDIVENPKALRINTIQNMAGDCTIVRFPGRHYLCIDCTSAYDTLVYAKENNIEKFDYAVLCSSQSREMLELAKSGKIRTLIMPVSEMRSGLSEYIDALSTQFGMETLWIDKDENIEVCGATLCYENVCNDYQGNGIVRLEYDNCSFVTMQSLSPTEIDTLYDDGVVICADLIKTPHLYSETQKKLSVLINGEIIKKDKEIILNP